MASQGQQCLYTDMNGNVWPAVIVEATTSGANCALLVYGSPTVYQVSRVNQGSGSNTWQALLTSLQAANQTLIAAAVATATIIKASPGVYYGMLVTSVGTTAPSAYDNASAGSGNVIGGVIAAAAINTQNVPAQGVITLNGLTIGGNAGNPAMTIYWA